MRPTLKFLSNVLINFLTSMGILNYTYLKSQHYNLEMKACVTFVSLPVSYFIYNDFFYLH